MNAIELATRHVQFARAGRAATENYRIKFVSQIVDHHVRADVRVGDEIDPFSAQQIDAAIDKSLLEFEFRNPVGQQPPDAIGALEKGYEMPGFIELRRAGQPRRT